METINRWHRELRARPLARKILSVVCKLVLILIALSVYAASVNRYYEQKAEIRFQRKLQEYAEAEEQAAKEMAEQDPLEIWIKQDAEVVARVLYGVKDNKREDLRTYCWCVFNRVDNPAFPNTLGEVVDQANQWMRYSPNNPVLESLYQIAYTEVKAWRTGEHRPVSNEYVFMNWTPTDICLRDNFRESSGTHYWRAN